MKLIFSVIPILILLSGCVNQVLPLIDNMLPDEELMPYNEIVMPPHSKIVANIKGSEIVIVSGKGVERFYSWEGATRSVKMQPRKSRWQGSLGMYYPGPGFHWKEHNGIRRFVGEEGIQNFNTVQDATSWLSEYGDPIAYRNDGLAVSFNKRLERYQLNVDVWQILIKGKKPTHLDEATDNAIKTSF